MAIAGLIAALEQAATEEARGIVDDATARARGIAATGADRSNRRRAELLAPEEARLRSDAERQLAGARRAARREVLLARRGLVERVLKEARGRLRDELGSARYRAVLPAHLGEALSYLNGRATIVRCPPRLAAPVRAATSSTDTRVVIDRDVASGILVEAEDGSVVVDNTLDARLDRLAGPLALDVLFRAGLT